jgi:Transposase
VGGGLARAVGGAGGLGHLLAQQLVAVGERVLDVQPKLGSRVRLLATGASNKNDPNDALSVAIAALRSRTQRPVTADDHDAVLRVWSRRHRDLGRAKNQVACRLHAVLCELVPGGVPEEITAAQDRVFTRLRGHADVWWARKDQIARWALDHPDTAAWVERDPPPSAACQDGAPEAGSGTCLPCRHREHNMDSPRPEYAR